MNKKILFALAGSIIGASVVSGALALGAQGELNVSVPRPATAKYVQSFGDSGSPSEISEAKATISRILEENLKLGNVTASDRQARYFGDHSEENFANLKLRLSEIWAARRVDEVFADFKEILTVDNTAGFDNHFDSVQLTVSDWQGVQVLPTEIHALFVSHFTFTTGANSSTDAETQWDVKLVLEDGSWKLAERTGKSID